MFLSEDMIMSLDMKIADILDCDQERIRATRCHKYSPKMMPPHFFLDNNYM